MESSITIMRIEDTRQRDDHGFVVSDSGDSRPCDICGRRHDVIVTLSDGRMVGSGCAKKKLGAAKLYAQPRWLVETGADILTPGAAVIDRIASDAEYRIEREWLDAKRLAAIAARHAANQSTRRWVAIRDQWTGQRLVLVVGAEVMQAPQWS